MRWWDVEAVLALEHALFPSDGWTAEGFWSELAGWPQTRHYVVAEEGDPRSGAPLPIVGYAGLLAPRRSDADIQTLAVAPSAQRRGIAGLLLDELLREALAHACPAVLLEVRADNPAAQRLYARRGFERISVRRGYYDAGRVDALVLRRRLGQPRPLFA